MKKAMSVLLVAALVLGLVGGVVGASAAGGFAHNMGQLLAAALIAQTPGLAYYLPTLAIAGALTGTLVGVLSSSVLKKLG